MLSLIANPTHFAYTQNPIQYLNVSSFPSLGYTLNPEKRAVKGRKAAFLDYLLGKRGGSFGADVGNSMCCWCRKESDSEGDSELEAKILAFMEKSEKPEKFPSRKELEKAGRFDLVEAIRRRGGWFSLGWEVVEAMDLDLEGFEESDFSRENEFIASGVDSFSRKNLTQTASSSGRSLEMTAEDESGVGGILSRLEKERNAFLGIGFGKYGQGRHASMKDNRDYNRSGISMDEGGNLSHYTKPDKWRTWSIQYSGYQNTEFGDAEILNNEFRLEGDRDAINGKLFETKNTEEYVHRKQINHNQIQTRLQHLESELSSVLRSIKEDSFLKKVPRSSTTDLQDLSDAWEFQENEFISAQENLRSLSAKLAVLEGKMALALIDARKVAEEKQRRIDSARKALQLLRTTQIVWPNSALEVLVAGSFDGWTSQRKMERSISGIFSLSLKLYPGNYEIKFIVDGIWKIDPLRPIVHNNGHKNNLLIIT